MNDMPKLTLATAIVARDTCADVFTVDGDAVTVATVRGDATVTVAGGNGHEGKRYPIAGMTMSRDLVRFAKRDGLLS